MKLIHTSDWQLGMTRHWLPAEAQARYTAARIDAIRSIGALARRHEVDAVLVAGDVFESNLLAPQTVRRSLEAMGAVPCPVVLLPGNHDPLDAVSIYRSEVFVASCPSNVQVIEEPGVLRLASGLEVVGAPWPGKGVVVDLLGAALSGLGPPGGVRVVLGHGQVDAISPDRDDPAVIGLAGVEQALADGVVHYVALGDRHSRLSVGGTGRVHYSGTSEVTDFDEELPGEVLLVEFDDDDPASPPTVTEHRVGTWRFVDVRRRLSCEEDVRLLDAELEAFDPKDRTVVRTSLTGTLGLAQKAALDDLLERQASSLGALFAWERHTDLAVVAGDDLEVGVGGFVGLAAAELAQRARGEEATAAGDGSAPVAAQVQAARDALTLLYRLTRGVRA